MLHKIGQNSCLELLNIGNSSKLIFNEISSGASSQLFNILITELAIPLCQYSPPSISFMLNFRGVAKIVLGSVGNICGIKSLIIAARSFKATWLILFSTAHVLIFPLNSECFTSSL